ncbi:hypothetical protein ACFLZ7_01620 [Nanoarchaeota archaeon]
MGFGKSLFSWLMNAIGFFVLLFGISMFTMSFFVDSLDSEGLYTIADEKIDSMIDSNLDGIKEEQLKTQGISLEDFERACEQTPGQTLCDDELLKEEIKKQIDIRESGGPITDLLTMLDDVKQKNLFLYGILLFIGGSVIILFGKSFDFIAALGVIAYESAFASFIAGVNFKVMPFLIEKLVSSSAAGMGAESELTSLIPNIILEWLNPALSKAFIVSVVLVAVFAVLGVIAYILKKKSSPKTD